MHSKFCNLHKTFKADGILINFNNYMTYFNIFIQHLKWK